MEKKAINEPLTFYNYTQLLQFNSDDWVGVSIHGSTHKNNYASETLAVCKFRRKKKKERKEKKKPSFRKEEHL